MFTSYFFIGGSDLKFRFSCLKVLDVNFTRSQQRDIKWQVDPVKDVQGKSLRKSEKHLSFPQLQLYIYLFTCIKFTQKCLTYLYFSCGSKFLGNSVVGLVLYLIMVVSLTLSKLSLSTTIKLSDLLYINCILLTRINLTCQTTQNCI